jgi:hypothetical protein
VKNYLPSVALTGCAALLLFGIVHLFELRFEQGDVYPAYSSLRADPLGAMAFYESLGKVSGISISRDFSDTDRLPEEPRTVYLHLAGSPYEFNEISPDLYRNIQDFLARGNRLVITYYPRTASEVFFNGEDETNSVTPEKSKDDKKSMVKKAAKKKVTDQDTEDESVSLEDKWGYSTGFEELVPNANSYAPAEVWNNTGLSLPQTLDWHSGTIFTNYGLAWHPIYIRGTNAVVMERKFGGGSVVMATDSYFISNEAMAKDRHADLLAWLVGANKNVVFDEAHLGIVETQGIATLMRKYRLHGLIAGLLLLAGLFIWKNSISLAPPLTANKKENLVLGKDSAEGFVNLLRRSIASRDLLSTCFAEWEKSAAAPGKPTSARHQDARTIFNSENSAAGDHHPVATYNKISIALGIKKNK